LNEETWPYANFHGLDYLQNLVDKTDKTQIEQALLVSIQWFGDATQELQPLSSFMKYYMPLEILLKRDEERAKDVVPNRICRLLDPWNIKKNRTTQRNADLHELIQERNSIFHSGEPEKKTPEYLRFAARWFSTAVIYQVQQRVISEELKTQDDLIVWLEAQAKKFP
jgi:hypothetical protein